MTIEQFEEYMQEYLELVNSKNDMKLADLISREQELMDKVRLQFMHDLIKCIPFFGKNPVHNEAIIREFEALFEYCFRPADMDPADFDLNDPWIREFQTRYLIFYERYYLSDQDLVQALIDIVCRRNYQIWHMRKAKVKNG